MVSRSTKNVTGNGGRIKNDTAQNRKMGERLLQCSELSVFCLRLRAALHTTPREKPRGN
jgi:hypothetical protein